MDLIKNIEIPDLEAIRDWSNAKLNKKVDKAEGKDLSANDYTNADKEKLDNLVQTEVKGDAESEYHKGKVNITPENIGALSNTGGNVGGPINGITTKMVEVPDQGGLDKYYLLNDITDWYNSPLGTTSIPIPSTCGFTGTLISHKSNGDLDNTVNNLAIAASNGMVLDDDGDNLLLRTTNEDYAPCILKDETNNKYYLALRVRGNGRYIFFIGRFSGSVINTFIVGGNNNGDWTMPSGYSVINKDYKIIAQTRVKGDAETEYRTGDVNITPENIGALPSKNIYRATFTKTSSSTPDLILECKFSDLSPGDLILINATNTYNTSAYIAIGTYPYIQDSNGERRQLKCQCAYVSQNGQSYRSTTTRSINLGCNACNLWSYVSADTTYTGGLFYSLSNIYFNLSTTSSYTATSSYPFTGTGANNMYKELTGMIDKCLPISGGELIGDFTVYADGSDSNPDLKVRDGRIDVLKTDGGNSTLVIDKSIFDLRTNNVALSVLDGTQAHNVITYGLNNLNLGTTEQTVIINGKLWNSLVDKFAFQSDTLLQFKDTQVDVLDHIVFRSRAEESSGQQYGLIGMYTDKVYLGVQTLDPFVSPASSGFTGISIEKDNYRFQFFRNGIKLFNVEEIATKAEIPDISPLLSVISGKWFKKSNGTYKFIFNDGKMVSNNGGINSSTAESTWTAYFDKATSFTLKYKISSETNYDKLTITLDENTIANAISGAGTEQTYTTTLTPGLHTLYAKYVKDSSNHSNEDQAQLEFSNLILSANDIT